MKLDNTISAVVTGGASGLGAATSRALAAKGVKVAIFDMNEENGMKVASEIGGTFCKVNITIEDEVDAAFAKAQTLGQNLGKRIRRHLIIAHKTLRAIHEFRHQHTTTPLRTARIHRGKKSGLHASTLST